MNHQATLTYDKEIIEKANKHFWLRSYTVKTVLGDSFVASLFAYQWIIGDRSWSLGFVGMCVVALLTIRIGTYFIPLRQGLTQFERMDSKEVHLTVTDETLAVESDLGFWEVPWKVIKKVWKFPEFWLIFPVDSGHFSLPTSGMDAEIQELITSHVQQHGGEVT